MNVILDKSTRQRKIKKKDKQKKTRKFTPVSFLSFFSHFSRYYVGALSSHAEVQLHVGEGFSVC